MLTPDDIADLTAWRRALHRQPEVSGDEAQTARTLAARLMAEGAHVTTGLGGHGVAGAWTAGAVPGPTVMIRAELDALPIAETGAADWASQVPGKGHLCGHDGHLAILAGVARLMSRRPPARGRVVLLGQPAEEDGSGAAAVLADPRFAALAPDWAFALHNWPGVPVGQARLAPGPANCASVGLRLTLTGWTAHAAEPGAGLSPAPAIARLIPALAALGPGGDLTADFRLVTVTHVRVGEPAFGIAPGEGELWVTLRTLTDDRMAALKADALALAAAEAGRLTLTHSFHDDFAACTNDPQATAHLAAAARATGLTVTPDDLPIRASEDFGRFGAVARSAMLFLGAGADLPRLHNPDYDFPDALIPQGAALFDRVIRDLTG